MARRACAGGASHALFGIPLRVHRGSTRRPQRQQPRPRTLGATPGSAVLAAFPGWPAGRGEPAGEFVEHAGSHVVVDEQAPAFEQAPLFGVEDAGLDPPAPVDARLHMLLEPAEPWADETRAERTSHGWAKPSPLSTAPSAALSAPASAADGVRGYRECNRHRVGPHAALILDFEAGCRDSCRCVASGVAPAERTRPEDPVHGALTESDGSPVREHMLVEERLAAGRRTRRSSASACAWSGTVLRTRHATAASNDSSSAGSRSATPSRISIRTAARAVWNRWRVRKHFEIEITDARLAFQRKHDQIAAEAALDGIYVPRTSVPGSELEAHRGTLPSRQMAHSASRCANCRVRRIAALGAGRGPHRPSRCWSATRRWTMSLVAGYSSP